MLWACRGWTACALMPQLAQHALRPPCIRCAVAVKRQVSVAVLVFVMLFLFLLCLNSTNILILERHCWRLRLCAPRSARCGFARGLLLALARAEPAPTAAHCACLPRASLQAAAPLMTSASADKRSCTDMQGGARRPRQEAPLSKRWHRAQHSRCQAHKAGSSRGKSAAGTTLHALGFPCRSVQQRPARSLPQAAGRPVCATALRAHVTRGRLRQARARTRPWGAQAGRPSGRRSARPPRTSCAWRWWRPCARGTPRPRWPRTMWPSPRVRRSPRPG